MKRWKSRRHAQHTTKQQPEAKNEGHPPAKDTGGGAPVVRAIVEIPESILEEYRRDQQEQTTDNRKNRTIAKWAVAGAWIYAAIAAFQFCTMQETVRDSHTELRAYLMPEAMTLLGVSAADRSANESKMTLGYSIANSGRTPASHVQSGANCQTFDIVRPITPQKMGFDLPDTFSCPSNYSSTQLTVAAQHSQISGHNFDPLDEQAVSEIEGHPPTKALVCFGCVSYQDIFGSKHCSTFCGVYISAGKGLMIQCDGRHEELDGCDANQTQKNNSP